MLAHLRTEAYPVYARHGYPPLGSSPALSYEHNLRRIAAAKDGLGSDLDFRSFADPLVRTP